MENVENTKGMGGVESVDLSDLQESLERFNRAVTGIDNTRARLLCAAVKRNISILTNEIDDFTVRALEGKTLTSAERRDLDGILEVQGALKQCLPYLILNSLGAE